MRSHLQTLVCLGHAPKHTQDCAIRMRRNFRPNFGIVHVRSSETRKMPSMSKLRQRNDQGRVFPSPLEWSPNVCSPYPPTTAHQLTVHSPGGPEFKSWTRGQSAPHAMTAGPRNRPGVDSCRRAARQKVFWYGQGVVTIH